MNIERVKELLEQIRDFGHVEGCCSSAPVYECCCFEKDQSELAVEALAALEDEATGRAITSPPRGCRNPSRDI